MAGIGQLNAAYEVTNDIKALGVVLDCLLTFWKHAMAVERSCSYRSQAIRHIRHLLSTELAVTLACSLILTRLDYCNSVLYGAPASSIQVLQRVQNNAARIVFQAPRQSHAQPLLRELYWLPARTRDTAVPAEGNGDLQTLICVLVARPRRCLTLSNPVP